MSRSPRAVTQTPARRAPSSVPARRQEGSRRPGSHSGPCPCSPSDEYTWPASKPVGRPSRYPRQERNSSNASGTNPAGGPNFWSYGTPSTYSSPMDYKSPGDYQTPFQYSPPSTTGEGGGGGSGGGRGFGLGGGGDGDGGRIGWVAAFVYAALGLVGYLAAGSSASLVGGAALSVPFAVSSLARRLSPALGSCLGLAFSALVFAFCLKKFRKSAKKQVSGTLLAFSAYVLATYAKIVLGGSF